MSKQSENSLGIVGERPVMSKLGRTKHRITLDCKKAGLTRSSKRSERTMLPRVSDAVSDIMELSETDMSLDLEVLILMGVLDFTDAFWMIPLHKSERRYFVTRIGDRYFVFLRTAQGSRGAPLT